MSVCFFSKNRDVFIIRLVKYFYDSAPESRVRQWIAGNPHPDAGISLLNKKNKS
jgi:hypothetical protein